MRKTVAKRLRKRASETATAKSTLKITWNKDRKHFEGAYYPKGSERRIYQDLKKEYYAELRL